MLVRWLEQLEPDIALATAGSKIARLAELAAIGISVPDGFVVTTAAHRAFVAGTDTASFIDAELAKIDGAPDALEPVAAAVRAAIEAVSIPPELADAVVQAYDELCDRRTALSIPVAVRSSAMGEDAADASFAGQFDTYLGLTGSQRVLEGIRACWASQFNDRAIEYRRRHKLSYQESPMAVGVLELVDAQAAGVAFSIDPVKGRRDRMVVEGSWGWGEAVVQGLVTPDHYEIDKADRRVLVHEIADKSVVSEFDYQLGRVVEGEMPDRLRNRAALDDEQLGAIADAVERIEGHYGYPVDIEWVLDRHRRVGEQITVVQVRPETVHADAEPEGPKWDPLRAISGFAINKGS